MAGCDWVGFKLAKATGKSDVDSRRDVLIAEKQHSMFKKQSADFREKMVIVDSIRDRDI
jgi:hypothetical protein